MLGHKSYIIGFSEFDFKAVLDHNIVGDPRNLDLSIFPYFWCRSQGLDKTILINCPYIFILKWKRASCFLGMSQSRKLRQGGLVHRHFFNGARSVNSTQQDSQLASFT